MKIIRMSSEPARNIIPTAASRIRAKYSPTWVVKSFSMEIRMVKIVRASRATLMNWVNGSTTRMPCMKLACSGSASIQAAAMAHPAHEINAPMMSRKRRSSPRNSIAKKRGLQRAQCVGHADQYADAGQNCQGRKRVPRANQDLQLSHEAAETRQAHGRDTCYNEGHGGEGDGFAQVQFLQRTQIARMRPVVNHSTHHSEQKPRNDAVGKHLQHGAAQTD